jgi:hypothetical protein
MFRFVNHGSIFLIHPVGVDALHYAQDIFAGARRWGQAAVCEPRFVSDLMEALAADGFEIEIA